ncbi:dephospho-CoA kinase [Lichenihabitans sp. Uapishka_5]|uniref:dephospho-CoA kinase n=1 Tax=Lichenihabitans sp. Uapishka_5 TaxID=3037302 RepID=UPI0029E7E1F6|nr:dephospho-CoA kinase [Lichenihabitans sp. Uapishka_5]MDX7953534.1 dephospho-CoA kinase [Lichenihabitans sp. Uapishka_5]
MQVIGLTGSIGMGKSTTAAMFRDAGVPVHDADASVHALYRGAAVAPVEAAFPGVTEGGAIDRDRLRARVLGDAAALQTLEAIVHPLVAAARDAFLDEAKASGAPLAVLDIPLLYEVGAERHCDRVAVVTAPEAVQKARVLARPGMTEAMFSAILARQVPDAEKRRRADWIIDTSGGLDAARRVVERIVAEAKRLHP